MAILQSQKNTDFQSITKQMAVSWSSDFNGGFRGRGLMSTDAFFSINHDKSASE
jgi:hypothetical protein